MNTYIPINLAIDKLKEILNKQKFSSVDSMRKSMVAAKEIEREFLDLHDSMETSHKNEWSVGDSLPIQNSLCKMAIIAYKSRNKIQRDMVLQLSSALPIQLSNRTHDFINKAGEYLYNFEKDREDNPEAQRACIIIRSEIDKLTRSSNIPNIISLMKTRALIQENLNSKIAEGNERDEHIKIFENIKVIIEGIAKLDNSKVYRPQSPIPTMEKYEKILNIANLVAHNGKSQADLSEEMVQPIVDILIKNDIPNLDKKIDELRIARDKIIENINADILICPDKRKESIRLIEALASMSANEIKDITELNTEQSMTY